MNWPVRICTGCHQEIEGVAFSLSFPWHQQSLTYCETCAQAKQAGEAA